MATFPEWHQAAVQKRKPSTSFRLWRNSSVFGIIVFLIFLLLYKGQSRGNDVVLANLALSATAVILIGLSMAFSGLCYFWNFVDSKIIYRKSLGICGFAFGLAHVLLSFTYYGILPSLGVQQNFWRDYTFGPIHVSNAYAFIAGLVAILIFLMMVVISNKYSVRELGGKQWRKNLRVSGYLGLVFLFLHFAIKRAGRWGDWFSGEQGIVPPLSLLLSVFLLAVFVLRISLWVSERKKNIGGEASTKETTQDHSSK